MEVVLEGILEMGKNPAKKSSKDWKMYLFVLKRHMDAQRSTLDYYKDVRKRWQKQVPKGVISLWPWFTISIAHNCSYKFAMKLMTNEHTLYIAANSFPFMNKWLYHIQTQRTLGEPRKGTYVFPVQAQDSDHMNSVGVRGDCLLALTTELEILCALSPSKEVVGVWPFDSLRRYWCGDGIFGFEAGRRSPRGEGTFSFISSQDAEICKALERFIRKAKRGSASSSGSSEDKTVDLRPPAPLPVDAHRSETPVQSSESDEEGGEKNNKRYSRNPTLKDHDDIIDIANAYDLVKSPPLPPKPMGTPLPDATPGSKMKVLTSTGSLRTGRATQQEGPDVSTNPSYLRRVRTHTGDTHQWLHKSVQKPKKEEKHSKELPLAQDIPPPPAAFTAAEIKVRDPLDEDTYSHTFHWLPPPFRNPASDHNVVGSSLYHALVHPGVKDTGLKRSQREGSENDESLYDLAFAPSGKSRHPVPGPESEYGSLKTAVKDSSIPRTKMPLVKMPLGLGQSPELRRTQKPLREETDAPSPKPIQQRKQSDDGMTVNPLYGSQDNLLAQLASLEDSLEVEKGTEGGKMKLVKVGEMSADKQAANPMYGEPNELGIQLGRERAEEAAESGDSQTQLLEEERQNGAELNCQDLDPSSGQVQKGHKGYSKVDKSKKVAAANRTEERPDEKTEDDRDETDSVPPPIPERNYSFDSIS